MPKNLILTKSEQLLLEGSLKTNTHAWKWTALFLYIVFLGGCISYLYIYLRTGLRIALSRAILCFAVLMVLRAFRGYQSLIRKLNAQCELTFPPKTGPVGS